MLKILISKEPLELEESFDDKSIFFLRNIHTYSHTFHIKINSLENINNVTNYCKVYIKVDTKIYRNDIFLKVLQKPILGLIKRNIITSGIFSYLRSANNLLAGFLWQSSISRDIKEDVKKLCEKLLLDIPSFHSFNSSALLRRVI